jgi:large subunit ribosomal protein L35
MPKLKTHSGAKKRFSVTASGKVKYQRAGRRHLLAPMTSAHKRFLNRKGYLNKTESKTMLTKFLPNA